MGGVSFLNSRQHDNPNRAIHHLPGTRATGCLRRREWKKCSWSVRKRSPLCAMRSVLWWAGLPRPSKVWYHTYKGRQPTRSCSAVQILDNSFWLSSWHRTHFWFLLYRGRGSDGGGVMDRVVSQLLTEIDSLGSETSQGIICLHRLMLRHY